jgi:hypothetical protein
MDRIFSWQRTNLHDIQSNDSSQDHYFVESRIALLQHTWTAGRDNGQQQWNRRLTNECVLLITFYELFILS